MDQVLSGQVLAWFAVTFCVLLHTVAKWTRWLFADSFHPILMTIFTFAVLLCPASHRLRSPDLADRLARRASNASASRSCLIICYAICCLPFVREFPRHCQSHDRNAISRQLFSWLRRWVLEAKKVNFLRNGGKYAAREPSTIAALPNSFFKTFRQKLGVYDQLSVRIAGKFTV